MQGSHVRWQGAVAGVDEPSELERSENGGTHPSPRPVLFTSGGSFTSSSRDFFTIRANSGSGQTDLLALLNPDGDDVLDESQGLLAGEKVVATAEAEVVVRQEGGGDLPRRGTLRLTNYRLFLDQEAADRRYWIPYGLILRWKVSLDKELGALIILECKDFRSVALYFSENRDHQVAIKCLKAHLSATSIKDLYAFQNSERYPVHAEIAGWPVYNVERELERQGVRYKEKDDPWRLVDFNAKFKLCPTYPAKLLVPRSLKKKELRKSETVLYGKRTMAFSWKNPSGEVIAMEAAEATRTWSSSSRTLFSSIFSVCIRTKYALRGIDASLQKRINAPQVEVSKVNSNRIKVLNVWMMSRTEVNNSFLRLKDYVQQFYIKWKSYAETGGATDFIARGQAAKLKQTKWLSCVKQLLRLNKIAASILATDAPLVIRGVGKSINEHHVSSLVQLYLDPYYRTMRGFSVLIEKEWLSFGHKFWQRPKKKVTASRLIKQHSPAFLLWLDAVYQIWDQQPQAFEFTSEYLICLMDAVYSSRFGTFLSNCEKQRIDEGVYTGSASVWSFLDMYKDNYLNPVYDEFAFPAGKMLTVKPRLVKFWADYYLRWEGQKAEMWAATKIYEFCTRRTQQAPSTAEHEKNPVINLELDMANSELHSIPSLLTMNNSVEEVNANAVSNDIVDRKKKTLRSTRGEMQASQWGLTDDLSRQRYRLSDVNTLRLDHNFIWSLGLLQVKKLRNLRVLDLSYNMLNSFSTKHPTIKSICSLLGELRELNLRGNNISRLPRQISKLTNLTLLDLNDNCLVNLPHSLIELDSSLQHLRFGYNPTLARLDFPSSIITRLTALRELDVRGNLYHTIDEDLFEKLVHLAELNLSDNYFNELPHSHQSLEMEPTNLRKLDISRLRLEDFSLPNLALVSALKELRAVDMELTTLPSVFSRLAALELLDLSHNFLQSIPDTVFQLVSLRHLLLRSNLVATLPPDIAQLQSLITLDIAANRLTALPIQLGSLESLTSLDISFNIIQQLPPQLAILPRLKSLSYEGNEIVDPPPAILQLGKDQVMHYMRKLLDGNECCNRIKLMLVGQENVGKSTLLRSLKYAANKVKGQRKIIEPEHTNLSTDGIDISRWTLPIKLNSSDGTSSEVKEVSVSAWDFAGQEIYYSTHQFFLSERSLFLFVFNVAQPNIELSSRMDFWLRSIQARAKSAAVIVVGTHIDDKICTPAYMETRRLYIDEYCASQFPNVRGVRFVSCTSGKGMDSLLALIEETIVAQGHIQETLPSSYLHFEKLILNLKYDRNQRTVRPSSSLSPEGSSARGNRPLSSPGEETQATVPVITWTEYKSIAKLCLIEGKELEIATTLLHNLGSIMYFKDDEKLADVVILDPQWLTQAMSAIVTFKHTYITSREGIMHHSILPLLWREPQFPASLHGFLLALLNRFEVAFTMNRIGSERQKISSDGDRPSDKSVIKISGGALSDQTLNKHEGKADRRSAIDYSGMSLIPFLLSDERPKDLDHLWPRRRRGDAIWAEFGRIYQLNFMPSGLMGRVMVRLLNFKLDKAKKYWRHGLLLENGPEMVLVEFVPSTNQLHITIRMQHQVTKSPTSKSEGTDSSTASKHGDEYERAAMNEHAALLRQQSQKFALRRQKAAVDALINDWYNLEVKVFVPCAHCVSNELHPPYLFTFQDCQSALFTKNSAYAICQRETSSSSGESPGSDNLATSLVRLDQLVPDVAMVHLQARRIDFSDLRLDKLVGKGGFAEVYRAVFRQTLNDHAEEYTERTVAVKKLLFTEDQENMESEEMAKAIEEFRNEVWVMSGVVHENIVPLIGFTMEPCCIVTEFIEGGSLWELIKRPNSDEVLTWSLRFKIAKDVAKGMQFLHSMNPPIMHRDLKTPNCMLVDISSGSRLVAKVIDFGVSSSTLSAVGRKVDCPVWLAPEIIRGEEYSVKSDVYSFGVILYELLVKHRYFADEKWMNKLENRVSSGERPAIPDDCLPEYRHLIEICWQNDPNERPTFDEIVTQIYGAMMKHCPQDALYDVMKLESDTMRTSALRSAPSRQPLTTRKSSAFSGRPATVRLSNSLPRSGHDQRRSLHSALLHRQSARILQPSTEGEDQNERMEYETRIRFENLTRRFERQASRQVNHTTLEVPLTSAPSLVRKPSSGSVPLLKMDNTAPAAEQTTQQTQLDSSRVQLSEDIQRVEWPPTAPDLISPRLSDTGKEEVQTEENDRTMEAKTSENVDEHSSVDETLAVREACIGSERANNVVTTKSTTTGSLFPLDNICRPTETESLIERRQREFQANAEKAALRAALRAQEMQQRKVLLERLKTAERETDSADQQSELTQHAENERNAVANADGGTDVKPLRKQASFSVPLSPRTTVRRAAAVNVGSHRGSAHTGQEE